MWKESINNTIYGSLVWTDVFQTWNVGMNMDWFCCKTWKFVIVKPGIHTSLGSLMLKNIFDQLVTKIIKTKIESSVYGGSVWTEMFSKSEMLVWTQVSLF